MFFTPQEILEIYNANKFMKISTLAQMLRLPVAYLEQLIEAQTPIVPQQKETLPKLNNISEDVKPPLTYSLPMSTNYPSSLESSGDKFLTSFPLAEVKKLVFGQPKLFKTTFSRKYRIISPLYSNVMSARYAQIDMDKFVECRNFDFLLFEQKLQYFFPKSSFTMFSFDFQSVPFFIWKATKVDSINCVQNTLERLLKGSTIDHFIFSRAARRIFQRAQMIFHINRDLFELLFPYGFHPKEVEFKPRRCSYACAQLFQNCAWHNDMNIGSSYDPMLAFARRYLVDMLSKVGILNTPEFWCSLHMILNDYTYQLGRWDLPENTQAVISQLTNRTTSVLFVPDEANPTDFWKFEEGDLPVAQSDSLELPYSQSEEMMEEVDLGASNNDIAATYRMFEDYSNSDPGQDWICRLCGFAYASRQDFQRHLDTRDHIEKLRVARSTIPEATRNPINYTRDHLMNKLTDTLDALGHFSDALPRWIKQHLRFIVNVVCNCVSIMFSKSWIAVLSSVGAIVNEIIAEFSTAIRDKVVQLAEALKQAIRRFFPHTQAQPTVEQDQMVANETFIKSFFAVLGSMLPGVQVNAGILKARIQRIQGLTAVLNAAKTIGEWLCVLFDKVWTWVQIYWYGATTEELARARGLLSQPDLTIWVNDISEFEYGRDGEAPGSTRLLNDPAAQERVMEMRRRGEEFLHTLSVTDTVTKTRALTLVQHNLRKLDKWYAIFEDSLALTDCKHEPFIVFLHGRAGVGKTYCINYLCKYLAAIVGRDFNPATDVFTKPRTTKFWDGYRSQFCVVMDDFLQIKDPEANYNEIAVIIDSGSRARYHLDMADCNRKASVYFNSPVVIVTSNCDLTPELFGNKLASFAAFARRLDAIVEVRRKPKWTPAAGSVFDTTGFYFDAKVFKCSAEDEIEDGSEGPMKGGKFDRLTENAYDWHAFTEAMGLLFYRKIRKQAQMDVVEDISEETLESMNEMLRLYGNEPGDDHEIVKHMFTDRGCVIEEDWDSLDPTQEPTEISIWSLSHSPTTIEFPEDERVIPRTRTLGVTDMPPRPRTNTQYSSPMRFPETHEGTQSEGGVALAARRAREAVIKSMQREPITTPEALKLCDPNPTAQSGPPRHIQTPRIIYCPIPSCHRPTGEETTRTDILAHFLIEGWIHNDERHRCLRTGAFKALYQKFPRSGNRPFTLDERETYAYIIGATEDYEIPELQLSLSQLYMSCEYDMARVIMDHYMTHVYKTPLRRILEYPYDLVTCTLRSIASAPQRIKAYFMGPMRAMERAIIESRAIFDRIGKSLRKVAIIGVLFTTIASVITMCYFKWRNHSNAVQIESFGGSGSLNTFAKKRQVRKIEAVKPEVVCRYVSNNPFSAITPIRVIKAQPSDRPDLVVHITSKQVKMMWDDQSLIDFDYSDQFDRDYKIGQRITEHYSQAKTSTEAKTEERLKIVKENIGKIPLNAEASVDPTAATIVGSLDTNLVHVTNPSAFLSLKGIFLRDTILMLPSHILGSSEPEGQLLHLATNLGPISGVLGKEWPYKLVTNKDTLFINVKSDVLPPRKSIISKFIQDNDPIKSDFAYIIVPALAPGRTRVGVAKWKQARNLEYLERVQYVTADQSDLLTIIGGVTYVADTESGDCGSLLVAFDDQTPRKLMGFHVAGETGRGYSVLWTKEKLEEAIQTFKVAQSALETRFAPIQLDDFFDCETDEDAFYDCEAIGVPYIQPLGMIPPHLSPGAPLKSKIVRSPLHNKIMDSISGPSTLRDFHNSEGKLIQPLKIALAKLESPVIVFDKKLVDLAAKRMVVDYCAKGWLTPYAKCPNGKLTLEENVRGCLDDQWIKPINMKTSPGYPYVLAGDKKLFIDAEKMWVHPILLDAIERREDAARRGEEMPALIVDCLKDERLPNEKREVGKVRIFNVCPLDFNMLVRKYFTRFLAQMMEHHNDGEVSVGINPHGDDWKMLYELKKRTGNHWIAGDYSAWDKRAPVQIALGVLPLVEQYYQQFDDYEIQDAVVRRVLIRQAYQSVRLSQRYEKGLVYQVHQSMPSGIAVTAVFNSLVNSLLFRVIFAELAQKHGWSQIRSINHYSKHVSFAAYGDDHIARVSGPVFPFFNMISIAETMAEHHITYTSPTKDAVNMLEIIDSELQYLKRRFVNRNGFIDAPMDEFAIIDILNWVCSTHPSDVRPACESAIRSVLIELSHHNKDTFEKWYAQILEQGKRAKLNVPITTYEEMVHQRRNMRYDELDEWL